MTSNTRSAIGSFDLFILAMSAGATAGATCLLISFTCTFLRSVNSSTTGSGLLIRFGFAADVRFPADTFGPAPFERAWLILFNLAALYSRRAARCAFIFARMQGLQ